MERKQQICLITVRLAMGVSTINYSSLLFNLISMLMSSGNTKRSRTEMFLGKQSEISKQRVPNL